MSNTFPMQPIKDARFVKNSIVERLLDESPFTMSEIATWEATDAERVQFAQLIGCSVVGFGELSYVDDATFEEAREQVRRQGMSEDAIRVEVLTKKLAAIQAGLKKVSEAAFDIHPDDLRCSNE